jgi:hypothetical protein
MTRNWAAHELLETTELLRKLTADMLMPSITRIWEWKINT